MSLTQCPKTAPKLQTLEEEEETPDQMGRQVVQALQTVVPLTPTSPLQPLVVGELPPLHPPFTSPHLRDRAAKVVRGLQVMGEEGVQQVWTLLT